MQHMKIIGIGLVCGTILISGCTASTTKLQENWGRSVETASYHQTVDPKAGDAAGFVEGMDGQSALKAVQTYRGQSK